MHSEFTDDSVRTTIYYDILLNKSRAKLFKLDKAEVAWKERGTGDVQLLKHKRTKKVRLLMRRDKTLEVCANHMSAYPNNLHICIPPKIVMRA